jgi:hypothetical protein
MTVLSAMYEKVRTAEVRFMRRTAGYSLLDLTRNEDLDSVENKSPQFKQMVKSCQQDGRH